MAQSASTARSGASQTIEAFVGETMDNAIAAVAVTQVGPEAKGLALDEIAPPTA